MEKLISALSAIAGRLLLSDEYEIVMGDIAEAEEGAVRGASYLVATLRKSGNRTK